MVPPWAEGEVAGGTVPELAELIYLWIAPDGSRFALSEVGEVFGADASGAPIHRAAPLARLDGSGLAPLS